MAENVAESGDFHVILGSFTCRKTRHWTDGFTSLQKEGVLRIFSPEKSDGFVFTNYGSIKLSQLILISFNTIVGTYFVLTTLYLQTFKWE
jgi:hypothetical protein